MKLFSILLLVFTISSAFGQTASSVSTPPPSPAEETEYKTADALWSHFQDEGIAIQKSHQKDSPSDLSHSNLPEQIGHLIAILNQFVNRFPNDQRAWKARIAIVQYQGLQAHYSNRAVDEQKINSELQEIIQAKDAPKDIAAVAASMVLNPKLIQLFHTPNPTTATWDEIEKLITDYVAHYKDQPISKTLVPQMWQAEVISLIKAGEKSRASRLISRLKNDSDPGVRAMALQAEKDLNAQALDRK